MKLSEDLAWRNLIKDKTFEDLSWLDTPKTFYLGVDCSADSLHIGNLAIFMLAKRLNKAGWKTVLLVGGATSLIGDPGGKSDERALSDRDVVAHNVQALKTQISSLFNGAEFSLVDNYDWFHMIGFLEFLRDVGKHYSMTELLQRDYISQRIGENGSGISYAEFSYTLIQGYDFWHLYKERGVCLQIGGSDQWGNMLSGVPLIRKKENVEVHAMSIPLIINKATGIKFGKSEAGAVWLDAKKTTPTAFYQFWINCDDEGIEDYLKFYTQLGAADIEALLNEHAKDPQQRLAQKKLAYEVTTLIHGEKAASRAIEITDYLNGNRSIAEADEEAIEEMRKNLPSLRVEATSSLILALVTVGLATSQTDARRLIKGNAVTLNGHKTQNETFSESDFLNGRLLIRRGKAFKDTALIEVENRAV